MKVIEIAEEQFLQLMEQSHALTRAVLREYERNLWRIGSPVKKYDREHADGAKNSCKIVEAGS